LNLKAEFRLDGLRLAGGFVGMWGAPVGLRMRLLTRSECVRSGLWHVGLREALLYGRACTAG
jgi:hypothetical protein